MPTIPLGRARLLASSLRREVREAGLPLDHLLPVGGLRRAVPEVRHVALLATVEQDRHAPVVRDLTRLPMVTGVRAEGSSVELITGRGLITVHLTTPDHAGAALVWHTGSRTHLDLLRARASARDLRFEGPVLYRSGVSQPCLTEAALYAHLELPDIPPELREGLDEVDAASSGRLPHLLDVQHIRGDLHMHTLWSDGRDSVREMVAAACDLGYEYIAITDHSERSFASRKLSRDDVARQADEIEAVRSEFADITVLHGAEVDIMHDGSLDFDDTLLARFDIVLASLHDHGGHDGAWLTERYLRAVRHPLVGLITHPANRSPGQVPGYDVAFERLFETAAETGTAVEVDGAPGHLDLDGTLSRQATAAGVTLTVDSDSHRADMLRLQMRLGVATARRGWVEPRHVLNTRPLDDVRTFLAAKRAARGVTSR